ncbi:hypothetical protein C8J57DRAFT_1516744 [Mycena rebaudengoi]|nr:hypothetical protein C8J57DRAFT_1516744 [Mycena rebaudengoi]
MSTSFFLSPHLLPHSAPLPVHPLVHCPSFTLLVYLTNRHSSRTPDHIFLRVDDCTRYTLQLCPQHVRARSELCPTRHAPAPLLELTLPASPSTRGDGQRAQPRMSLQWEERAHLTLPRHTCCPHHHRVGQHVELPPNRLRCPHHSSIGFASYSASSHINIAAKHPSTHRFPTSIELFVMLHMIPAPCAAAICS